MSPREGVLSDRSIKFMNPEYFPLDLGTQLDMSNPAFMSHKLKGMKVPKKLKHHLTFARFPISDLKNYSAVSVPQNATQAGYESIINYREKLGSSNVPTVETTSAYAQQKEQTYNPRVAPDLPKQNVFSSDRYSTPSGSLSLGRNRRDFAVYEFNRKYKIEKNYLTPQTKSMIMNLGDESVIQNLLENVFPPTLPGRHGVIPHHQALSHLTKHYRDSPDDIEIIRRAEMSARHQTTIPSREDFGGRILDNFGRFGNPFAPLEEEGEKEQDINVLNPDDRM